MNIILKTRLKELFRSRKDAIVFITIILAAFFFAARTLMTGYDLLSAPKLNASLNSKMAGFPLTRSKSDNLKMSHAC